MAVRLNENYQDADGKEIIDFISMLSATNLGQCHPELVKAMTTSMQNSKYQPYGHTSVQTIPSSNSSNGLR